MTLREALSGIACLKICKLTTQLLTTTSSQRSRRISQEKGIVLGAVKLWIRTSWCRLQKISALANSCLAQPTPTTTPDWTMVTILRLTRQSSTVNSILLMRLSSAVRSIILFTARNASPTTRNTVAIRCWPQSHTVFSNNSWRLEWYILRKRRSLLASSTPTKLKLKTYTRCFTTHSTKCAAKCWNKNTRCELRWTRLRQRPRL